MLIFPIYPGNMNKGKLILIPTPIGNDASFPQIFFPRELLNALDVFVVEELTTARRFLKRTGYPKPFEEVEFLVLNEQSKPGEAADFLRFIKAGRSVGLLSEAGLPCIADPGSAAVRIAHQNQVEVVPLPGPSSIYLTLMASGANGQAFSFHGYLPIDKNARSRKILEMEKMARQTAVSQIFMETPYRNEQLTEALLHSCKEDTMLCVACDLLSTEQQIISKTIREWKVKKEINLHKRPAVYVLFY